MSLSDTPREGGNLKLEKIASAAQRMAVSIAQIYREAHAGRLTIIKVGTRASALNVSQVDAWIAARMEEARRRATKKGGTQ